MLGYDNASTVVHQEVEHFCDFPNSSYGASVERFLSQVPLSTFIRLTRWISALRTEYSVYYSLPGRTLFRHLAALIKPNIQPHLKDPDSFARFLCWAAYVPGSRLSAQGHDYASSNHRWPRDLRHIVLVMTVLPSEFPFSLAFSHEEICALFSIPSMSFLNSALLIVLKALELGLRHSRRWKYSEVHHTKWWKGPRDREIIQKIFLGLDVSLDIWIYALDCEQTLQDDFRTHIQKSLGLYDGSIRGNQFQRLHNPQRPPASGVVSPLDFALAECAWNVDQFQHESVHDLFLRDDKYNQILIPSIPELAMYLKEHWDGPCRVYVPASVVLSPCGCILIV
ncbi:hypothetical protein BJ165DRAFT_635579 [Panaeolus papilionaceus]|nr:hypothetical protein BJ165DRAFT_635579 [Panaeolus papilionaceus]